MSLQKWRKSKKKKQKEGKELKKFGKRSHSEVVKHTIPTSVQKTIPVQAIWKDGIFQSGRTFSKTFHFEDVNYQIQDNEGKKQLFLSYSSLLNGFESDDVFQITIYNHKRNTAELREKVLFPQQDDGLDPYRDEFNQMLLDHANEGNGIVQDRYLTITSSQEEMGIVRNQFSRMGIDLQQRLSELGSSCTPLNCRERLQMLHDFYRPGEETIYHFDFQETKRLGHDFRDYICPDSMEKNLDYLKIGKKFCRVLFIKDYASNISDKMIRELTDFDRDMMLTLTVIPMSTEKAHQLAEFKLMGAESNISNWQQKQNRRNNFSATVPFQKEQEREECREFLNDLENRDQRVFFVTLTLLHLADSLEQLDQDTDNFRAVARKRVCQLSPLTFQQLDGLNTTLPFGVNQIAANRTMTTEVLSAFMPFNVQEIHHEKGHYFGQNVISNNMIFVNEFQLQNANSFILGLSGAGKSMFAKEYMTQLRLGTDADIIIIDPEREYLPLIEQFGGEIIRVSSTSDNHINALEVRQGHDENIEKAVQRKQEFVLSLCEEIIGTGRIDAKAKSMIDRCTGKLYFQYVKNKMQGSAPTLKDLYEELKRQPEDIGKELALELELYATGSMNTFAKQTNVDIQNRLICYDILELGSDLMTVGMLVVLDNILNRINRNREDGKKTYIFIDEIYLLFLHEYSSTFLYKLWKRVRKYGGCCIGMTQNVSDILDSNTASAMISNSEFLVMLNQSPTDSQLLAQLLHIPEPQLQYITNVKAGHGLLKVGPSLVPFANEFPKDTELYKMMTTKQDEVYAQKQQRKAVK